MCGSTPKPADPHPSALPEGEHHPTNLSPHWMAPHPCFHYTIIIIKWSSVIKETQLDSQHALTYQQHAEVP